MLSICFNRRKILYWDPILIRLNLDTSKRESTNIHDTLSNIVFQLVERVLVLHFSYIGLEWTSHSKDTDSILQSQSARSFPWSFGIGQTWWRKHTEVLHLNNNGRHSSMFWQCQTRSLGVSVRDSNDPLAVGLIICTLNWTTSFFHSCGNCHVKFESSIWVKGSK